MATQNTTQNTTQFVEAIDQLTNRFTAYNEQAIDAGRRLSGVYVDSYERTVTSLADLEEKVGSATRNEWLTSITAAHAALTRELAHASSAAARELLR